MRDATTTTLFERPVQGIPTEVVDGVFWLQMPLPFALNHVNLWVLDDGDGWVIVDTGMSTDTVKQLWETALTTHLAGRPINRIIATHFHPDHAGLSGYLSKRTSAPVAMPPTEWELARHIGTRSDAEFVAGQQAFFRHHGLDATTLGRLANHGNTYSNRIEPIVDEIEPLAAGDVLNIGGRQWRVVMGSGHSPSLATLWCESEHLLLSVDQILPKITPNISVLWVRQDTDPLHDFLTSLQNFAWLPDDTLALPGHRIPFTGVPQRLTELADHHEHRLNAALSACVDTPQTATDLLPVLFEREMDDHQLVFALGEAVAHLVYLAKRGYLEPVDDGEVRRYATRRPTISLSDEMEPS
ncbi:MAG: MBL fold metallo-hydrolase [Pseudomonadota bacterium]